MCCLARSARLIKTRCFICVELKAVMCFDQETLRRSRDDRSLSTVCTSSHVRPLNTNTTALMHHNRYDNNYNTGQRLENKVCAFMFLHLFVFITSICFSPSYYYYYYDFNLFLTPEHENTHLRMWKDDFCEILLLAGSICSVRPRYKHQNHPFAAWLQRLTIIPEPQTWDDVQTPAASQGRAAMDVAAHTLWTLCFYSEQNHSYLNLCSAPASQQRAESSDSLRPVSGLELLHFETCIIYILGSGRTLISCCCHYRAAWGGNSFLQRDVSTFNFHLAAAH